MNKLIALFLLAGLGATQAHALTSEDKIYLMNHMNAASAKAQLGTTLADSIHAASDANALGVKRTMHIVFNTATKTGDGLTSTGGSIGTSDVGDNLSLPANSLITRSFYAIDSQFAGVGGSVAISCGSNAGNIIPATTLTSYSGGTIRDGASTGTVATMQANDVGCKIKSTVTNTIQTAGKMDIFLEYVVGAP